MSLALLPFVQLDRTHGYGPCNEGSNPSWEAIAYRQGVINAAVHSPQMGGKNKLMLG